MEKSNARDELWRARLLNSHRYDVMDDFSPLVAEKVLTWREVVRFSPLTDLFAKVFIREMLSDRKIKSRNKELENIGLPVHYIPRSCIRYGNLTFTVIDSSDVEIKTSGNKDIKVLQGKKGIRLTHLVVEGEFLFTLRTDGIIVQWNYLKGEIVKEIKTTFALGEPLFDQWKKQRLREFRGIDDTLCGHDSFEVKDGFIVIQYPRGVDQCEIINYADANESLLFTNKSTPTRLLIKHNKLYILKTHSVIAFDLTKEPTQTFDIKLDPTYFTRDIVTEKNILCASSCFGKILVLDTFTAKEIKSFKFTGINSNSWLHMTMIGNLFIGFSEKKEMTVIDLNTQQILDNIPDFFHFETNIINPIAFTRLINICKPNLSEIIQVNKHEPNQCVIA